MHLKKKNQIYIINKNSWNNKKLLCFAEININNRNVWYVSMLKFITGSISAYETFESVCRTLKSICIRQVCIRNMFRDSGCLEGKGGGNFSQISRNARCEKKKEISKEMRFLVRRNNITDLFMNRVRLVPWNRTSNPQFLT